MYCQTCLDTIYSRLNKDCLILIEYLYKQKACSQINALENDEIIGDLKGPLKNKHRIEKTLDCLNILGLVNVEYRSVPKKVFLSEDGVRIYGLINRTRLSA